jgi:hypothetical protein
LNFDKKRSVAIFEGVIWQKKKINGMLTTLADQCPSCFTIKIWVVTFNTLIGVKKLRTGRELEDRFPRQQQNTKINESL